MVEMDKSARPTGGRQVAERDMYLPTALLISVQFLCSLYWKMVLFCSTWDRAGVCARARGEGAGEGGP